MADRLVRVPLWSATAIASTASLTSGAINLRFADFEALLFQAVSASGTADVKFEYAVSDDGVTFGSFDDEPDLLGSSAGLTTPEGLHTIAGVTVAAPWMQVKATGVGSNPADTVLTATVVLREASS